MQYSLTPFGLFVTAALVVPNYESLVRRTTFRKVSLFTNISTTHENGRKTMSLTHIMFDRYMSELKHHVTL